MNGILFCIGQEIEKILDIASPERENPEEIAQEQEKQKYLAKLTPEERWLYDAWIKRFT